MCALQAARDANEIRFLVRDLVWQLEADAREAAAAEKERSKRRSNPLYALRRDFRLLLAARRPELYTWDHFAQPLLDHAAAVLTRLPHTADRRRRRP